MQEDTHFIWSRDRVELFSDAVFAIILTLLVLELRAPEIGDRATFSQYVIAMTPLIPKFISFILTFALVCIHWVSHHYFFGHLRRTPVGMVWLNNIFLLWLCFMPFPTAMLGNHPTDQFPILLYGLNQLLTALTFFALRYYAAHNGLFISEASAKDMGPRHSIPAVTIFIVSMVLAFVNVYLSLACFLVVPMLYFFPNFIKFK
jgi:uncharacterized membrane protein